MTLSFRVACVSVSFERQNNITKVPIFPPSKPRCNTLWNLFNSVDILREDIRLQKTEVTTNNIFGLFKLQIGHEGNSASQWKNNLWPAGDTTTWWGFLFKTDYSLDEVLQIQGAQEFFHILNTLRLSHPTSFKDHISFFFFFCLNKKKNF